MSVYIFDLVINLELVYYFFFLAIACTLIPIPTIPYVIYLGSKYDPLLLAIIGGAGTTAGCVVEYLVLSKLGKWEKIARLKTKIPFEKYKRIFKRIGFFSLFIAGFTPLPIDPLIVVAILLRYNLIKYAIAIFFGKAILYYFLAKLGHKYDIPFHWLIFLFAILILWAVFVYLRERNKQ